MEKSKAVFVEGFDGKQTSIFEGSDGDALNMMLMSIPAESASVVNFKESGAKFCKSVKRNTSMFAKVKPVEQTFIDAVFAMFPKKAKASKMSSIRRKVRAFNTYNEAWVLAYASRKVKELC